MVERDPDCDTNNDTDREEGGEVRHTTESLQNPLQGLALSAAVAGNISDEILAWNLSN